MPIYLYQASGNNHCEHCRNGFEILQKLRDAPLDRCPECSAAVMKVISAPNIGNSLSPGKGSSEKHGFTQYKRLEKGVYEKTEGKGPPLISDKDS